MTARWIADIASYQDGLTLADVRRAGFDTVNVKISHGLGLQTVHPNAAGWVRNTAGLAVSTFHYLTGDASGVAQARYAYGRMAALGVPDRSAHTVDCEADAGWQQVVEYVTAMRALLRRPVALYTGDWWWTAAGRGWSAPDLLPYVWAAPSQGYLTRYPGDADARWTINYAGQTSLAVMQYAVGPVARASGPPVNVSMSAVRDAAVWADLSTPREDGVTVAPDSLKEARTLIIAETGLDPLSVGIVGDDNHQQTGSSYHLGKSGLRADSYSIIESSRDKNGLSEDAAALDIGKFSIRRGGRTHTLITFSLWLVAQCKAGAADTADIREVIYSPDGVTVKRWDRLGKRTTGDDSHLIHTHMSYFRDSTRRDKVSLFRRYFKEIEGDMDATEMTAWAQSDAGKTALAGAVVPALLGTMLGRTGPTVAVSLQDGYAMTSGLTKAVAALAVLAQAEAAEVPPSTAEILDAFRAVVGGHETSVAEKAALLRAVLGADAGAVGALLTQPSQG